MTNSVDGTISLNDAAGGGARPAGTGHHVLALPAGARIGDYEIVDLLGSGGFGIVYRALDLQLKFPRAIKEYLPKSIATRQSGHTVSRISPQDAEAYSAGLASFKREAQTLAQIEHRNVVRVVALAEANATAYMVMELINGPSLSQFLERTASVDPPVVHSWFVQLLEGLGALHRLELLHRDIKPGNILLRDGREPILIDLGAARSVVTDVTQSTDAVLSPGYSPIEQYDKTHTLAQGPATDLYALGATMYRLMTGAALPPAPTRAVRDAVVPLKQRLAGSRYPSKMLDIVDRMISVRMKDRPQSVDDVLQALKTYSPLPYEHQKPSVARLLLRVAIWAMAIGALIYLCDYLLLRFGE